MKATTGGALLLVLFLGCAITPTTDRSADQVLVAPVIHTMDPECPTVTALAIRDGRIIARGTRAEVQALAGPQTRHLELPAGTCVVPGFIESHAHLFGIGQQSQQVDLVGTRSYAEVVERVARRAAAVPAGQWIFGRGWDQNDWAQQEYPHHGPLSAAVPDHPVWLTRVDGHAALVNATALQQAGVTAATSAPAGGELIRDPAGGITGVLIDAAMERVSSILPPPDRAQRDAQLAAALAACRRRGITTFHDAGTTRAELTCLRRAQEAGGLSCRIYVMLDGSDPDLLDEHFAAGPWSAADGFLTVRSVKLYADGALGSRGAALLEPYADRAGHRGLEQFDGERIAAVTARALQHGFQVGTHAIGDRGNRSVLDAYQRALRQTPVRDARLRVEHAQILHPDDIGRFAGLGVIASMQAVHCTSDMPWVPARLGEARTRAGAYVWQTLLQSGAVVCNGTDAPVESLSALECFYAAVTRQDQQGQPAEGFLPEQRMTRHQALHSYTQAGAFAAFAEHELGALKVGYRADLAALSRDILTVPAREILATDVLLTMVDGEVVWNALTPTPGESE